mmetsp:Transcript_20252/g.28491  ORF Transcript_20252/g.28491 Transcript_20252/m.28491 type:complete len:617 (-) Transcript_20252:78-1928(-)
MSSGQEVGKIFREGSGPATALLRSPTVIIASIGLWGLNVYLFRIFGIDYVRVLKLDLIKERLEKQKKEEGDAATSTSTALSSSQTSLSESERQIEMKSLTASSSSSKSSTNQNRTQTQIQAQSQSQNQSQRHSSSNNLSTASENEGRASPSSLLYSFSSPPESADMNNDRLDSKDNIDEETIIGAGAGAGSGGETLSFICKSFNMEEQKSSTSNRNANPYYHITEYKLVALSIVLMVLLHTTSIVWMDLFKGTTMGAIFFFYATAATGIILPFQYTQWLRNAFLIVIKRAAELVNPRCSCVGASKPRPVPFIDVFFADAMCSLSKVFFDWGMLWHMAAYYPNPVPASPLSIIIPSCFASLPYIIRARQCLVMYTIGKRKNDPKRIAHVLNAIKYSTSLFPLIVSAYQKTIASDDIQGSLEILLIFLLAVNATYSLLWDIIMDWGMMQRPNAIVETMVGQCAGGMISIPLSQNDVPMTPRTIPNSCIDVALRPTLRFGAPLSILILLFDIFLRYSWMLRFVEHIIFPDNNDGYILCTQYLEVFRRAMWNLLRVEWENIKQAKDKKNVESNHPHSQKMSDLEQLLDKAPDSNVSITHTVNIGASKRSAHEKYPSSKTI